MFKIIPLLVITVISCSTRLPEKAVTNVQEKREETKEFARGEVILYTDLLVKIFDKEMSPLSCVKDTEEASLLLRTVRPRMEVVEDDLEALLDQKNEVRKLIDTCHLSCTCDYLDDLLREHTVVLSKEEQVILAKKKNKKETNRCLTYAQETFCQSEIYKALNMEKADFSFNEEDSL